MWSDVETDRDFLNFKVLAGLAAQMILDAKGKPLSIGIAGGWGVGKSSMVRLIENDLRAAKKDDIIFLNFNAWLYQGVDDARAALMEEISRTLMKRAEGNETLLEKGKDLASRVNLFRTAKIGGEMLVSYMTGVPVTPLMAGVENLYEHVTEGAFTADDVDGARKLAKDNAAEAKALIRPKKKETPPQAIQAFRDHFRKLLEDLKVTLVVFVDDLDRCLPPTVIGTLEAMRLFLFMDNTAFVIAADDEMIKQAVRIHFKEARLDDDLVLSYFDKLIQVPLRVPPLGINEVRAYLAMLFIDNSDLDDEAKAKVREGVNARLSRSWKGESVTAEYVGSLVANCPGPLRAELALGDRLAKQMAVSRKIAGNPRLIKRFLNTLSIRRKLAALQDIQVDVAVLAKVLLFERCANPESFQFLVQAVNSANEGAPGDFAAIERQVRENDDLPEDGWLFPRDKAFVKEWLKLDPPLGDVDLRGALHVGRENLPIFAANDRISAEAMDLLSACLALKLKPQPELKIRLARLPAEERAFVMDKLLEKAASEQTWGTPPILWGLALGADADPSEAKRLVVFMTGLQSSALLPSIVPRISGTEWGKEILAEWKSRDDLEEPLRKHLTTRTKAGR